MRDRQLLRRLRPQPSLNLEPLEPRELLDAAASMFFVNRVYQDLLHRPADPTALSSLTAALVQGTISRATVVVAVENSAEFRINEVEALYSLLLHRSADASGLNSFTAFLAAGASPEQAGAAIAGSPEYFATRSGGTNDGFLDALYGALLHRTADPGGRATFDFALAAGATRTQVATVIYASMEYRQDLVQSFYVQFLHRSADLPGLNAFVAALQAGASDAQVIAA